MRGKSENRERENGEREVEKRERAREGERGRERDYVPPLDLAFPPQKKEQQTKNKKKQDQKKRNTIAFPKTKSRGWRERGRKRQKKKNTRIRDGLKPGTAQGQGMNTAGTCIQGAGHLTCEATKYVIHFYVTYCRTLESRAPLISSI